MSLKNYKKFADYNQIFENLQKAKKILKVKNIDPDTSEDFKRLRDLVGNNTGYMGKFTQWFFEDGHKFEAVEEIYEMIIEFGIDKSIDEFKTLEGLYDYIQELDIKHKVNHMLVGLRSSVRNRVKKDERLLNILKFGSSFYKTVRSNFEEISYRYTDKSVEYIIDETNVFIKNLMGDFNLNYILNYIELNKLDVDVIISKPNLLVIQVNSWKAAKDTVLGSTSWCISTSKQQWDYYVGLADVQYFVYDFTKDVTDIKHRIGITISMDGRWKHVHYADDSTPKSHAEVYQLFEEKE